MEHYHCSFCCSI